jgi:rhodanese-related sulfurtransferase
MITMALRLMGYTNVTDLNGGLGAWKTAKMPVAGYTDWATVWPEFTASMPDNGMFAIKADALNTMLADKPPFLLDVREAAEIEKDGYIAGAVHIPVREVLKNLDKLPAQDEKIVVYCASGHRGGMVMAALRALGYTDVVNLNGGTGAWKKANFPLETGLPAEAKAGKAPEVDAGRLAALDAFISGLPEGFYSVKSADLNTELASSTPPVIVDVRTPEETAKGYIEGSLLLPVEKVLASLDQLPAKDQPIVVTCQSGHRGSIVMMALRQMGYTNVRNLNGGINAWTAAELPLVTE